MDKYRKNFIICDGVIYYCLLCNELIRGIPSAEKHIRWDKHRQKLKSQDYFPKFKKNFIHKIDNNFYCETCNLALYDIFAVTDHIKTDEHKAMKTNPKPDKEPIGRYDSGYIVLNNTKVTMTQWHSIVNMKCYVCDMEVENALTHMGLKEHLINLINTGTKCNNERYYRKINDDRYHCLSCKKVYSYQEFAIHWPTCEYIEERKTKTRKEGECSKNIGNPTADTAEDDTSRYDLVGLAKDYFLVDTRANTATCKICTVVMETNSSLMSEHMKIHLITEALKTKPNVSAEGSETLSIRSSDDEFMYCDIVDCGKRRKELAEFGKANSIKLNFNGGKGWCSVCDRPLSANKTVFQIHAIGAMHQGNLELQGRISTKTHDTTNVETKSIAQCRMQFLYDNQFLLLDFFSVDLFSFFLLYKIKDRNLKKTKCFACSELVTHGKEMEHCFSTQHKINFFAARIVTSPVAQGHFFRQIRPNYFHCGFCNITFPFVELMIKHTGVLRHKIMQRSNIDECVQFQHYYEESDEFYASLVKHGFRQ